MYKCIYLKYKIMLSWALPCRPNRDLTADCTIYLSLLCLPLTSERKLQSYTRRPASADRTARAANFRRDLKMICNDFLVVKVNCWSYVFNIIQSIRILRNIKDKKIAEKSV